MVVILWLLFVCKLEANILKQIKITKTNRYLLHSQFLVYEKKVY